MAKARLKACVRVSRAAVIAATSTSNFKRTFGAASVPHADLKRAGEAARGVAKAFRSELRANVSGAVETAGAASDAYFKILKRREVPLDTANLKRASGNSSVEGSRSGRVLGERAPIANEAHFRVGSAPGRADRMAPASRV